MVDPITDLLNRIRNAAMAQHASTRVPHSKIKESIVDILKREGYLDDYSTDKGDGVHKEIIVHLRYIDDSRTAIKRMRRISKPGRRWYCGAKELPQIKSGLGVAIVSTSKGVMTDRDARRMNIGGEVLCEIW
jgi:small subunit ribosomal protein S8